MNLEPSLQICYLSNAAPHYREALFRLMDKELGCDFYIGDSVPGVKEYIDGFTLKGFRATLINTETFGGRWLPDLIGRLTGNTGALSNFYWQKGAPAIAFKPYTHYIIDGEPYCLSTWVLLMLVRLRRRKAILWSHGWYGDEGRIKRIVKRLFFNLANTVLLYGDHARSLMIGEGFDPRKLVCIYNALDPDNQVKLREELLNLQHPDEHSAAGTGPDPATGNSRHIYRDHFNNADPVLIFMGRIQPSKKPEQLVKAWEKLNMEGLPCNLVMIGEETGVVMPGVAPDLKDRMWRVGPLFEERKMAEFIFHADVCVSPGNIGLAAIHSLTYGTPVITHDNFAHQGPEFEAITPGVTGDYFRENDIGDLSRTIKKWISCSPGQRVNVRQESYKAITDRYNPHRMISIIKNALN